MAASVAGKSVIVTGAANGVGLAIARLFVQNGARVVLADMDEEKLQTEVEAMTASGGQAQAYSCDLREKLSINNLIAMTIDHFDRVDVLVNASRQVITSDPLDSGDDGFDAMMHQNVTVSLRLSQAVARRMIQQAKDREPTEEIGAIVNLSSIAARQTLPELVSFSIASAALDQMTRSLAVAFAKHGIRVNAVALGSIMSGSLLETLGDNEDLREKIINATPMGRIGEAAEAGEVALFLASDCASFMTGQIVTVDGGRSLLDRLDQPGH